MDRASSAEQILELTGDFFATWTPHDILQLPPSCRPACELDADRITFYAFELVREQIFDRSGSRELQRMAAFFGIASQRLSQLMANVSARDDRHWQQATPAHPPR